MEANSISRIAPGGAPAPMPAAQYVRMSTDHQRYSPENQSTVNQAYAASSGLEIVLTYYDRGRSGLTIERREALKQLICDVESGSAVFGAILVYDVSRWGRFQNADEAAYYEYLCTRAGIAVHYCAEQFQNDGSPFAAIVKSIKRAMAGEFSRELSVKTFTGQRRLIHMGFRIGGRAGYGLRRMLIDEQGTTKGTLERGQWKSITTDRIVLVPGPKAEVEAIRWIFHAFVHKRKSESQIADWLNKRGILNHHGRPWNRHAIKNILRNEKYIGNNVWNHNSFKLKRVHIRNAVDEWVRRDGAFEPLVDQMLFEAAQTLRRDRHPVGGPARRFTDNELLVRLRRLWRRRGYLSRSLIDCARGVPSAGAYEKRFGRLSRAYELIGYDIESNAGEATRRRSNEELLEMLRRLWRKHKKLSYTIIEESSQAPCVPTYRKRFGSLAQAYRLIGYAKRTR